MVLDKLVCFHSTVQMHKIVHLGTPANLRNEITILQDKKIKTIPGRLKIVRDSYRWRTVRAWNDLPSHLTDITKLPLFKKHLKKHIIEGRADVTVRRPPDLD